jgi:Geminivirus Rep catalytic domain./RNA helicase.
LTYPKCPLTKEEVHALLEAKGRAIYGSVIARELHEDGSPHIHVYLLLESDYHCRSSSYWDLGGYHGNYQHAKSYAAVVQYIKKDKDYTEFGDLDFAAKIVAKTTHAAYLGKRLMTEPLLDVVSDHPELALRYEQLRRSKLAITQDQLKNPPHETTRGTWIRGPPGSGKTHSVHATESDLYCKAQNKWWDGYTGQKAVLMDDFDQQGECLAHHMKIWADKWPCQGETKGGHVPLTYDRLIVTSNFTIDQAFKNSDPETIKALHRRFKKIHKLDHNLCLSDTD